MEERESVQMKSKLSFSLKRKKNFKQTVPHIRRKGDGF